MKIALVRVPTMIEPGASSATVCPPLGQAYLKAICNRFTSQIQVIDAVGNWPTVRSVNEFGREWSLLGQTSDEIASSLDPSTDLILVSIMFSQDWPYSMQVMKKIRERCSKAILVAGGEHITAAPKLSMDMAPELDMCVLGEGEPVLYEILTRLQTSSQLPLDIGSTLVRGENGYLQNPRKQRIINLDTVPLPDWDGFPLENYLANGHGFGVNRGRSMPIMATRGCPYQCTFCSSPNMWTTLWKARKPEDVIDEMKSYINKYKIDNFDFYDLTAIIRKDWIVTFCKLLIKENLKITWQLPSGTRSEAIDGEVAGLLYQSGCRNLAYAPESGSPSVLKSIKKKIDVNKMLVSMRSSYKKGMSVKANIICGFPGENKIHLSESYQFIIKMALLGVEDVAIMQFSPYPGSELFERLTCEGKLRVDAQYFEGLSYYSSFTKADSYSEFLSNRDILYFKLIGTATFYLISLSMRPTRIWRMIRNVYRGIENTRLEKSLNGYFSRIRRNNRKPKLVVTQSSPIN